MPRFPLVDVGGTPYEVGRELGAKLGDRIRRSLDRLLEVEIVADSGLPTDSAGEPGAPLSRDVVLARTASFRKLLKTYAPDLLEEIRGISDGSGIALEEALLLQIRGEILYAGGCTTFALPRAATRGRRILIGQNWDYAADLELMVVLRVTPARGPRQLMMSFAGLSSYMGINSAGVGQFANSLPWGPAPAGLPHYPFKWRLFREESLEGVRALAAATAIGRPGNYVLSGSGQVADLEITPEGAFWPEPVGGFFVHTNHFLHPLLAARKELAPTIADSPARYARMQAIVAEHAGSIDVAVMQRILRDHAGYPVSICRHPDRPGAMYTSASLIAEPEEGVLHVCAGNPCAGEYVSYSLG